MTVIPLKRVGLQNVASIPGCMRQVLSDEHWELRWLVEAQHVRIKSKGNKHETHVVHVSKFEFLDPMDEGPVVQSAPATVAPKK